MVAAALLAVGSAPVSRAANLTWNQTGYNPAADWTAKANWGSVGNLFYPDAEGDTASLTADLSADEKKLVYRWHS